MTKLNNLTLIPMLTLKDFSQLQTLMESLNRLILPPMFGLKIMYLEDLNFWAPDFKVTF